MKKIINYILAILISSTVSVLITESLIGNQLEIKNQQQTELQKKIELLQEQIEILKEYPNIEEIGDYIDEKIKNRFSYVVRKLRTLEEKQIKFEKEKEEEPWVAPADYQEIPYVSSVSMK